MAQHEKIVDSDVPERLCVPKLRLNFRSAPDYVFAQAVTPQPRVVATHRWLSR